MTAFFEPLYLPDDRDRAIFGAAYIPPVRFRHGEWTCVASYAAVGGDGRVVEVDECRMPARFFRLRAHATASRPSFVLTTGSGDDMGALVVAMAKAIAGGMLSVWSMGGPA